MVYTDQTSALRALLPAAAPSDSGPSSARPSSPSSSSSFTLSNTHGREHSGALRSRRPLSPKGTSTGTGSRSRSRANRRGAGARRKVLSQDEVREEEEGRAFMEEAYRIIRKPYLSLTEPPPLSRRRPPGRMHRHRDRDRDGHDGPHADDEDEGEDEDGQQGGWARWDGAKYMTDKEREEVDVRSKMILRRCRERVGVLEDGEKARQKRVIPAPSILAAFLPSLAASTSSAASSSGLEPLITAHRASVLLSLNTLLAGTTQRLTELQEERAKRRAERGRTLAEGAGREAERMKRESEGGFFARALDSLATGPESAAHSHSHSHNVIDDPAAAPPAAPTDDALAHLSPAQIQQFESENNALLTHLESTLSSVLAAEKSLLEISEMQTQLVQHLTQQTEMVDMLYEQAVGSVGEMRGAKEQLVRAKERGGEARLFLLVFLVGASVALLFLDWYS